MKTKKIFLTSLTIISAILAQAQSNTFPSNGNVGIGTSSPPYKLTVNGALYMYESSSNQGFSIEGQSSHIQMSSYQSPFILFSDDYNNFQLKFSTDQIRYNSSSNTYKYLSNLDLSTVTLSNLITIEGTQTLNPGWTFPTTGTYSGNAISLFTEEQGYDHEIDLTCGGTNTGITISNGTGSQASIKTTDISVGSLAASQYSTSIEGSFYVKQGGATKFSVQQSTGNTSISGSLNAIGASTFNGSAKFYNKVEVLSGSTVNVSISNTGVLKAREIFVTLDNIGDFVFEDDYQRLSLSELETYVYQNKHLPGIPTCDDVAIGGLDVGNMTNDLLIKVEELTLYIIELNKEVVALKEQLNLIENE